jgi:hypothetical protein
VKTGELLLISFPFGISPLFIQFCLLKSLASAVEPTGVPALGHVRDSIAQKYNRLFSRWNPMKPTCMSLAPYYRSGFEPCHRNIQIPTLQQVMTAIVQGAQHEEAMANKCRHQKWAKKHMSFANSVETNAKLLMMSFR